MEALLIFFAVAILVSVILSGLVSYAALIIVTRLYQEIEWEDDES